MEVLIEMMSFEQEGRRGGLKRRSRLMKISDLKKGVKELPWSTAYLYFVEYSSHESRII